jgi:hypothetical protein
MIVNIRLAISVWGLAMYIKIIGYLLSIAFVALSWYVYIIYPSVPALIFAILVSVVTIACLSFLGFLGLNITYSGSAASDAYAREHYENYEIGSFYLSDHGDFVEVSEDIWKLMNTAEKVVFPLFIVAFLWNFIAIVKEKGLKSSFSRK